MLAEPAVMPLKEAARRLDLDSWQVRIKFKDLAKRISAKYLEASAADARHKETERMAWIRMAAEDLAEEGLRITPKAVIARLDIPYVTFRRDQPMIREICAAVARDRPS